MPTLNVEWDDHVSLSKRWAEMDGRAFLEAIGKHELSLPPILSVLNITAGSIGDGWIEFSMRPQPFMMNLAGTVHGGVLATLIDSALTCALVTRLPRGMVCVSIDLDLRFFRPARMSAELLTARAEVLNAGSTIGTTQGEIRDARGKLIVHGTSSLAIAPAQNMLNERASPES